MLLGSLMGRLLQVNDGIEMLELDACIGRRKAPLHRGVRGGAARLPGRDFLAQGRLVRTAAVPTLAAKDTELERGHGEPTALLWGMVPLQPGPDTPRLRRRDR